MGFLVQQQQQQVCGFTPRFSFIVRSDREKIQDCTDDVVDADDDDGSRPQVRLAQGLPGPAKFYARHHRKYHFWVLLLHRVK